MKNKKGLTIIELIEVLVILSVITLLAVPAYRSSRKRVLNGQYNNLVSLIETSAKKYGSSTKKSITFVQDLINQGLLETDDGTNIYDPSDKSIMNCYAIRIDYENGNYGTKLLKEYKNDTGCVVQGICGC